MVYKRLQFSPAASQSLGPPPCSPRWLPEEEAGLAGAVESDPSRNRFGKILSELMGSLKFGNVWVFVQSMHRPTRTKNQLYRNPNIA